MNLLVIGGSGLVGSNVVEFASGIGAEVHMTYYSTETKQTKIQLDKTNAERTVALIEDIDPGVIIDTAAFHAVDTCETERETAWEVNAAGTRNVAFAANDIGAHFIYLSTDYVFAGHPDEAPYNETDPVAPINYYAQTKYAGEQAAKIADDVAILRPSVIYGMANANFATWALGELADGNEIGIVDDQVSTPTYAPDIATAGVEIAERGLTGLYHSTGPESLSRYEFTTLLADIYGYNPDLISPITTEELGQEAPRPEDSSLDSTKLYDAIDYEFRDPETAIKDMYERESNESE